MQAFVIETTQELFLSSVGGYINNGYKLIAGSSYIKSLPENINIMSGQVLNDIEHVFSVAVRDHADHLIFSKNISLFREEVNIQLKKSNTVIGSLYLSAILKDNYEKCRRKQTTYYSCCLEKG